MNGETMVWPFYSESTNYTEQMGVLLNLKPISMSHEDIDAAMGWIVQLHGKMMINHNQLQRNRKFRRKAQAYPICSMYGIFTHIYPKITQSCRQIFQHHGASGYFCHVHPFSPILMLHLRGTRKSITPVKLHSSSKKGPGLTRFANGYGISGEYIYNFNSPEIDGKYIYLGNFLMFVGIITQKVRVLGW